MIAVIDNYDSFTYNIVQYLKEIGAEVSIFKNDEVTVEELDGYSPSALIISPGPGTPMDAGISTDVLGTISHKIPTLGVCLGHQCIGHVFGADVVNAREIIHGKVSTVYHDGKGVFQGIDVTGFDATRYHSLVVSRESLPKELTVSAWTQTECGEFDEVMGIRHKLLPIEGVQFHPESILSQHGHTLFRNFLSFYR